MTKLQLHPRRDEFPALRAKVEATPVRRPQPFRPAYPGVSADVLREMRAETAEPSPAEQLRHAWTMTFAPLHDLLAEPTPTTDWTAIVRGIQAGALRRLTQVAADVHAEQLAEVAL